MVVVTGQTVVEVTTEEVFDPTGQLVTVGAQEVIVYSMVEKIVEVVHGTSVEVDGVGIGVAVDSLSVTGQTVVYLLFRNIELVLPKWENREVKQWV